MSRTIAAALGLALVFHGLLLSALDLSDLPGPGSALWALDAFQGTMKEGLASFPLRLTTPLLGLHALRLQQVMALLLATWGVALGARALGGSGALAATAAACWGLVQYQSILLDVGTTAWGLSWFGLGLAWWGGSHGAGRWIALGAALALLGASTKLTALPALALLAMVPWLAAAGKRLRTVAWAGLGVGLAIVLTWLTLPAATPSLPMTRGMSSDWTVVASLVASPGHFSLLAAFALLGTIPSGPHRRRRIALWSASITLLVAATWAGDRTLRHRHLLPLSFGLPVLLGCIELDKGRTRLRRAGALGALVLLLSSGLGWMADWSTEREGFITLRPHRIPSFFSRLHWPSGLLPGVRFRESSLESASELTALAEEGRGMVLTVPIRDRRESFLNLQALLAGREFRILSSQVCCEPLEEQAACAARILEAWKKSNAQLILPPQPQMQPKEAQAWSRLFSAELRHRPGPRESSFWREHQARGALPFVACVPRTPIAP